MKKKYIARKKCWKTLDGRIVEDLDPAAATLLARGEGQELSEAEVAGLSNVEEFFKSVTETISE